MGHPSGPQPHIGRAVSTKNEVQPSDQTTLGLSFLNINTNCPYHIGLLGVVLHELVQSRAQHRGLAHGKCSENGRGKGREPMRQVLLAPPLLMRKQTQRLGNSPRVT